jgi:hypothetical protein
MWDYLWSLAARQHKRVVFACREGKDFGFVSIKIAAIGQYLNICDVKIKMQTADLHSLFELRSIFEKIGLSDFVM